MKSRIVGLVFAGLLICIPSARADTIAITGASFSADPGHSGLTITTSQFALNFIVPRSTVDLSSYAFKGDDGHPGEHYHHGFLSESGEGTGYSFPPALNPPAATTADALLHLGFVTISTPSGPSLAFTIHAPSTEGGGGSYGGGPGGPGAGFPGIVNWVDVGSGGGPHGGDPGILGGPHLLLSGDPAPLTSNPEPATLVLMATGFLMVGRSYRRRRSAS